MDVNVLVGKVPDREFVHVLGFINSHLLLRERFLKCEECFVGLIFSVDKKDCQVLVCVRSGEAIAGRCDWTILLRESYRETD